MKNIYLILLILVALNSFGQKKDSSFFFLNKSKLKSNVVYFNPDTSRNWSRLDGKKQLKINNREVFQVYNELNSYQLEEKLPELETLYSKTTSEIKNNNRVPLIMIHYAYDEIKENALRDSLIIIEDNKFLDGPNTSESPYILKQLFTIAPAKSTLLGTVNFFISRNFLFANTVIIGNPRIDFGDGNGSREIPWETTIPVEYGHKTEATTITVEIETEEEQVLRAMSASDVEYCRGDYLPMDEIMSITSQFPYQELSPNIRHPQATNQNPAGYAHSNAYIKYSDLYPGQLVKPIIFIEGIDFGHEANNLFDTLGRPIRNGDFGWCEFWGKSYNPENPSDVLHGYYEFSNSGPLLNTLLARGYSIILMDFQDGADFIGQMPMPLLNC